MSAREVLDTLRSAGLERVEVYRKRGRTRRVERSLGGCSVSMAEEVGWSVRAGNDTVSLFFGATGEPTSEVPWPEPLIGGLRLPGATPAPAWRWPPELETPLIGEREALRLVAGIESALDEEMKGARLLDVTLDDGASESWIESTTGLEAYSRYRLATIRLSAMRRSDGPASVSMALIARSAAGFVPVTLARRLADLMTVHEDRDQGVVPARRGALLAPEVAARVLAALQPALMGAQAWRHLRALQGEDGRFASPMVTLVDNGRLEGGLLASPVDGEGVPTREVVLVDAGIVLQPLLPWWQEDAGAVISGCCGRASWREPPALGATHLYLAPRAGVAVASLLERLGKGVYMIDAERPRVDLENDRFELSGSGFVIERGRPVATLAQVRFGGSVQSLLRGIVGVGRDLRFVPEGGLIGAPSTLVEGLEWF